MPAFATPSVTQAKLASATALANDATWAPQDSDSELPACPPAYDFTRTDYVAGEEVEIMGKIFVCNDGEGYEKYCKLSSWDPALLEEDGNAKEMWNDAWVEVGPCERVTLDRDGSDATTTPAATTSATTTTTTDVLITETSNPTTSLPSKGPSTISAPSASKSLSNPTDVSFRLSFVAIENCT